ATHAGDQLPVGDPRGDEDRVTALHEVLGLVHLVEVQARVDAALALRVVARLQAALDVAAERLDGAGRDDALRAAADADAHVGAGAVPRGVDAGGDGAGAHQPRAGAGLADLGDQPLMAGTVQHRDHDLLDRL